MKMVFPFGAVGGADSLRKGLRLSGSAVNKKTSADGPGRQAVETSWKRNSMEVLKAIMDSLSPDTAVKETLRNPFRPSEVSGNCGLGSTMPRNAWSQTAEDDTKPRSPAGNPARQSTKLALSDEGIGLYKTDYNGGIEPLHPQICRRRTDTRNAICGSYIHERFDDSH